MIKTNLPIILASASPRRKELLQQAGFTFQTHPSTIEEQRTKSEPDELAQELAFQKAADIYNSLKNTYGQNDFLVIGADTIVSYNGEIFGKPEDEQEAFDMLKLLSDRTHQVYTGIALIMKKEGKKDISLFCERTDVTFFPINDYALKEYIRTGDSMDKAGAYGIQGAFAVHVKEIKGDYNNVVGLPIARLYQVLSSKNCLIC